MKACACEMTGDGFVKDCAARPQPDGSKKATLKLADTGYLLADLFQWDYLMSRPLED
ncbi:MAG: hypothetical protein ACOYEO_01330 [bacterium]|jgi:hypothetical protein